MPIGSFIAERRDPRPKQVRQKKEKSPAMPVSPKEEGMVFEEMAVDSMKLNILLWGRNLSVLQDFLCSMSENMSQALHPEGMTFYTRELSSISDVVDRKKKLERYFWEFSKKDWVCPEQEKSSQIYTFSISPSGSQQKSLDLVVHCCSYANGASLSYAQADAVWFLMDGPVMDENVGYDAYAEFLKDTVSQLSVQETMKPVCLLLSQIERLGHFGGVGELSELPDKVRQQLIDFCRERFSCSEDVPVALIPVQVYGGLEYTGTDEQCNPVLRMSQSGYYQSYIPENCQVPGMYTIDLIGKSRELDFFAGAPGGGMRRVIHRHFVRKLGQIDWKPDMLREADTV